MDQLQRLAEAVQVKRGPQHFVTTDDLLNGSLQFLYIERQSQVKTGDVDGVVRAIFAMKDQPGLQMRQWVSVFHLTGQLPAILCGDDTERLSLMGARAVVISHAERLGQLSDRLVSKELLEREQQSSLLRFGAHLYAANGIPAKREVVVVNAHLLHAEHFRPDFGQCLFDPVGRRCVDSFPFRPLPVGTGKRTPVDLSLGRQGQFVKKDESSRHHVIGQLFLHHLAQFTDCWRLIVAGNNVSDQALLIQRVLTCQDDALSYGRMFIKRSLHFSRLNAEATDFHLLVNATEVLNVATGQAARAVSCAVQSRAGFAAERVRNKTLGGQFGATKIAARQPCAAHIHLTGNA